MTSACFMILSIDGVSCERVGFLSPCQVAAHASSVSVAPSGHDPPGLELAPHTAHTTSALSSAQLSPGLRSGHTGHSDL